MIGIEIGIVNQDNVLMTNMVVTMLVILKPMIIWVKIITCIMVVKVMLNKKEIVIIQIHVCVMLNDTFNYQTQKNDW